MTKNEKSLKQRFTDFLTKVRASARKKEETIRRELNQEMGMSSYGGHLEERLERIQALDDEKTTKATLNQSELHESVGASVSVPQLHRRPMLWEREGEKGQSGTKKMALDQSELHESTGVSVSAQPHRRPMLWEREGEEGQSDAKKTTLDQYITREPNGESLYKGSIAAMEKGYIYQNVSSKSVVRHEEACIEGIDTMALKVGDNVKINYSNGKATIKQLAKEKENEISR